MVASKYVGPSAKPQTLTRAEPQISILARFFGFGRIFFINNIIIIIILFVTSTYLIHINVIARLELGNVQQSCRLLKQCISKWFYTNSDASKILTMRQIGNERSRKMFLLFAFQKGKAKSKTMKDRNDSN